MIFVLVLGHPAVNIFTTFGGDKIKAARSWFQL